MMQRGSMSALNFEEQNVKYALTLMLAALSIICKPLGAVLVTGSVLYLVVLLATGEIENEV